MLWYDSTNDIMKVYSGSAFANAGSSVNGTSGRFKYIATANQTTFSGASHSDTGGATLVYDSGFMLGDGVWEGLRLHNGQWTFIDEHLDRLFEAARAIDLDIGLDREGVEKALFQVQHANSMHTDAHARLMVTRGVKTRPFQHPSLSQSGPTFVIIAEHSQPKLPRPIKLASVPHIRGLPMSQDPKLNSHSKLNCVLACIAAEKAGADEALMLDVNGFVNTTNACNFFIIRRDQVWTSTGDYCMNGITRQKVIDLCKENNIEIYEKNIHF